MTWKFVGILFSMYRRNVDIESTSNLANVLVGFILDIWVFKTPLNKMI